MEVAPFDVQRVAILVEFSDDCTSEVASPCRFFRSEPVTFDSGVPTMSGPKPMIGTSASVDRNSILSNSVRIGVLTQVLKHTPKGIAVNPPSAIDSPRFVAGNSEALREIWVFLVAMGVALVLLGAATIGSAFVVTRATMLVFGILLLLGAVFQIITALWGRSWRGFFLQLLAGVLYLIVGVFMIDHPVEAALGATLLVGIGLLASGMIRAFLSLIERFDGWQWMLVSGVVSALLGVGIWRQWPLSGLWVIGLFVGIEMLSSGVSWVMLGLAVRTPPKVPLPTHA